MTVLVAAAALDIAAAWVRFIDSARSPIAAIAALGPLLLFGLELVQVADRIRWSAHLLGGWLVVAATVGALVGLIGRLGSTDAGQRAVEAETALIRRPGRRLAIVAAMLGQPPFPLTIEVVVEIPRGSRNKYEYDEAAGVFRLDRVLSSRRVLQLRLRLHRGHAGR